MMAQHQAPQINQQGAGFHLAACFHKHLQTYLVDRNNSRTLKQLHSHQGRTKSVLQISEALRVILHLQVSLLLQPLILSQQRQVAVLVSLVYQISQKQMHNQLLNRACLIQD